jgi:D-threo-aldose 1-dehydrogenase
LGTGTLGGLYEAVPEDVARATIRRAIEIGVRYLDTAPLYGYGISEKRLGEVVREYNRNELVISTKVGRLLRPPGLGAPLHTRYKGVPSLQPLFDFSRDGVLRSIEESRTRTGLDHFDILLVHDPDDHLNEALDGAVPALHELRAEGAVSAIGVGTNSVRAALRLVEQADLDCLLIANRFTLLDQSALADLLPACARLKVAVIGAGIFNSGLLADPRNSPMFDYETASPTLVERALEIEATCARHNVPLRAAALQFPLLHPAVTCVLPGCRSPAEIEDGLSLFQTPIPTDLWAELRSMNVISEDVPLP